MAIRGTHDITMHVTRGVPVVPIDTGLDADLLHAVKDARLQRLRSQSFRGVIVDLSGVPVIDASEFELIRQTVRMASVMATRVLLSGLQPGMISALVRIDVDVADIDAVATLDDGLESFARRDPPPGTAA